MRVILLKYSRLRQPILVVAVDSVGALDTLVRLAEQASALDQHCATEFFLGGGALLPVMKIRKWIPAGMSASGSALFCTAGAEASLGFLRATVRRPHHRPQARANIKPRLRALRVGQAQALDSVHVKSCSVRQRLPSQRHRLAQ